MPRVPGVVVFRRICGVALSDIRPLASGREQTWPVRRPCRPAHLAATSRRAANAARTH